MKKLIKTTSAALALSLALSTAVFARESLPVRTTLEEQGFTVSWDNDNKCVIIEKGEYKKVEPIGENITLDYDTTYADSEFFEKILVESGSLCVDPRPSKTVTVEKADKDGILAKTDVGEVLFKFDEKTLFRHEKNKRAYTVADIKEGMTLRIFHSEAMTMSIPAQCYASEIVILEDSDEAQLAHTTATVKEIAEGYVLASNDTLGEVMFLCDENTFIHHQFNKKHYTIADVKAGDKVEFIHADAMTASLPPQVYVSEMVVLASAVTAVPEDNKIHTLATVVEVGDTYIATNPDASFSTASYIFNIDENTIIRGKAGEKNCTIADIKVGDIVEFVHGEAMTRSVPPQSYAYEIILLASADGTKEAAKTTAATVTEVGAGYVLASNDEMGEVMFRFDEDTTITCVRDGQPFAVIDLDVNKLGDYIHVGDTVIFTHAEAMTASIPPQVYTYQAIVE